MKKSDTSERGLERLICTALTGHPCDPVPTESDAVREEDTSYGGYGWIGAIRTTMTESTAWT